MNRGLAAMAAVSAGWALTAAPAAAAVRVGWVFAGQPDAAGPYVPDPARSFNSEGGTNTVAPVSTGVYAVTLPGLAEGAQPDNVQVGAVNTNGYCMLGGWQAAGDDPTATVRCFDAQGVPANAAFSLLYQARGAPAGREAKGLAFVLADQPDALSYSPARQYSSLGQAATVVRPNPGVHGQYWVRLPGFDKIGGMALVTALGADPARCKIDGYSQDSDGAIFAVNCFDGQGIQTDQAFSLAFTRDLAFGARGRQVTGAYAQVVKISKHGNYAVRGPYSFNGWTVGKPAVTHTGKGLFTVEVPGAEGYASSIALVGAWQYGHFYGSDYCNVTDWYPLQVACFMQGGAPADNGFILGFTTR